MIKVMCVVFVGRFISENNRYAIDWRRHNWNPFKRLWMSLSITALLDTKWGSPAILAPPCVSLSAPVVHRPSPMQQFLASSLSSILALNVPVSACVCLSIDSYFFVQGEWNQPNPHKLIIIGKTELLARELAQQLSSSCTASGCCISERDAAQLFFKICC